MAMIIPTWFDACYLQNILRNSENDESIEIFNLTVKAATNEGDNYTSDMYRATVEFSRIRGSNKVQEEISLILKVLPYNDTREDWIQESGIFDTELSMLSEILPKMNEIITRLAYTSLGARCLHISNEKPIHIIVDDLAPKGFRMAERHSGLDLDHCSVALRNLGRFHAASVALKEKEPAILENYKTGMYNMDQNLTITNFWKKNLVHLAGEITNWPELNPRIADKLLKLSEVVYEKGCQASRYQENDFIVMNHGDFWINNMMFRYDDKGKPIDNIFVDFQLSHWSSPADDILYFLGSSPSYQVRFHHRELVLHEYYLSLTNTMTELQCATKAPSFEELQEILRKRAFHEALASMFILPVVTLEKDKSLDMSIMMKNDEKFENPGNRGKLFKKIMIRVLPSFDNMGLLDV